MYLRLNNQRITTINNIDYIIKNKPPNRINPPIIFEKNVLVCYSNINEAMNLVQHYLLVIVLGWKVQNFKQ